MCRKVMLVGSMPTLFGSPPLALIVPTSIDTMFSVPTPTKLSVKTVLSRWL
jgi:hypothetical protein